MKRRDFLKLSAVTTAGLLSGACASQKAPTRQDSATNQGASQTARFFDLHPFVVAHPDAVFIQRTDVGDKLETEAKLQAGRELAEQLFVYGTEEGIPVTHTMALKPNLTCAQSEGGTPRGMGILTDRAFVEGLIEGMKALGFSADRMAMREGNWLQDGYCARDLATTGYVEMAERTGVQMLDFPTGRKLPELTLPMLEPDKEVIWKEIPDGVVFKRIGYIAPYNAAESWLLDIAKLKAHGMGMTLCAKNLQGTVVSPHLHFCEGVDTTLSHPPAIFQDFQPDLEAHVTDLHAQHLKEGYARWDRPGRDWNSGYGMEMWAQRTCDSLSVTDVGFSIIEGIYGRNGDGFLEGPGSNGEAEDFMSNVLIFGKDPLRVDIVGTWFAGHEPRNFGLFHIARERGLCDVVEPDEIPLYDWNQGKPEIASLSDVERVPLLTRYLRRDYDGTDEPLYHLVNEPAA